MPVARQMEEIFPCADHFITQNYRNEQPRLWNTECFVGQRYVLTMQVPVTVDYRTPSLSIAGPYRFYVAEVADIHVLLDGRVQGRYGQQAGFDVDTWKTIYEGRSLSAATDLGIVFDPSPVKGFDEFVHAVRKDRIRVSLIE